MVFNTTATDDSGVMELSVDLSEDAGLEAGSIVVVTKIRGDAAFYAGIVANDYKANHPDLFPMPDDLIVEPNMMEGGIIE